MYYEQLVLHPEAQMRELLAFLDLPWNSSVLHHSELIGKEISLSKVERSSDQVIKPVNTDALSKWVKHIPQDVKDDMADIAPMLKQLGYDPHANPPNYGQPDSFVRKNNNLIHKKADYYDEKASQMGLHRVTEKPLAQQ
jgi:protein-tyrosine sulfotransferase